MFKTPIFLTGLLVAGLCLSPLPALNAAPKKAAPKKAAKPNNDPAKDATVQKAKQRYEAAKEATSKAKERLDAAQARVSAATRASVEARKAGGSSSPMIGKAMQARREAASELEAFKTKALRALRDDKEYVTLKYGLADVSKQIARAKSGTKPDAKALVKLTEAKFDLENKVKEYETAALLKVEGAKRVMDQLDAAEAALAEARREAASSRAGKSGGDDRAEQKAAYAALTEARKAYSDAKRDESKARKVGLYAYEQAQKKISDRKRKEALAKARKNNKNKNNKNKNNKNNNGKNAGGIKVPQVPKVKR